MAYRNLNTFGMPGGFNITSGEPIDSRMIVEDINHIYEEGNWTNNVKPYNGLIVSSRAGEVRVCINATAYQNPESWVEVGGSSKTVNTYSEAIALAKADSIGLLIYVKTESSYPEEEGKTYSAGLYIVIRDQTLSKVSTSSAEGDLSGDVEKLKSDIKTLKDTTVPAISSKADKNESNIAGLTPKVTTLEGKMSTAEREIDTAQSDITGIKSRLDTIEGENGGFKNKIETINVAGRDLVPSSKKVTITFDTTIEDESQSVNAPQTKAVSAKLKELKQQISAIPKFKIEVVEESDPETGVPTVGAPDSSTIYLVTAADGDESNLYTEWIYVNKTWEKLGVQKVDLSGYATTASVDSKISTAKTELNSEITKVDNKFANYTNTTTLESTYAKKTDLGAAKTEVKGYTDTKIQEAKTAISSEIDSDVNAMAGTLRGELSTEALTEEEIQQAITEASTPTLDNLV